ncbi:MAG: DUF4160 domain-containing protein [Thermodesulfobacteriota bacterium]|nr:DUF4160 domain-containing protein [Thermodesulfobacteriota bacterium]
MGFEHYGKIKKYRSANGCDVLPEEFHSFSEAANFWDTHDSIDYESMMKGVDFYKIATKRRGIKMPYVSMFFGIIIRMFYNEHNPPHFHAEYQGQRGVFDFNGNLIKGHIKSNTARKLIKEWVLLHQEELEGNWKKAEQKKQIDRIAPLD